jgi:hypothetical protein
LENDTDNWDFFLKTQVAQSIRQNTIGALKSSMVGGNQKITEGNAT